MPTYEHMCKSCDYEWEDTYSMTKDPPTICPQCQKETAMRVISGGGHGKMVLNDAEWKESLKDETRKFKKELYSSEKAYSNFISESKYQTLQQNIDKNKKGY